MALAISFGFSLLWHFVYVEIQNGAPSRLTLPGKLARNCCRRQALTSFRRSYPSLQVLVLLIFQSHGLIPNIQRGRDFTIFFSAPLLFFFEKFLPTWPPTNEFIILENIFSVNGSIQANFWKHPESYCNRVQITLLSTTIFYWDFPVQNKNLVLYK